MNLEKQALKNHTSEVFAILQNTSGLQTQYLCQGQAGEDEW